MPSTRLPGFHGPRLQTTIGEMGEDNTFSTISLDRYMACQYLYQL